MHTEAVELRREIAMDEQTHSVLPSSGRLSVADTAPVGADGQKMGMSLIDHLFEFRRRILISLAAVAAGTSIGWCYAGKVVGLLIHPMDRMVFLTPAEAFLTYLKVSAFLGLLLASPVILHQIWIFVGPALYAHEKKLVFMLVPLSVALFLLGMVFSYCLVLPAALQFFMGFATGQLQPVFSLGAYISFVISFMLPFGLIFQLPLFLLVLARAGVISSHVLVCKRRFFVVLAFVLGALAAPTPDVFSQVMVAIPLLLLYEISIWAIKGFLHR